MGVLIYVNIERLRLLKIVVIYANDVCRQSPLLLESTQIADSQLMPHTFLSDILVHTRKHDIGGT
jgi:hypothetical protein